MKIKVTNNKGNSESTQANAPRRSSSRKCKRKTKQRVGWHIRQPIFFVRRRYCSSAPQYCISADDIAHPQSDIATPPTILHVRASILQFRTPILRVRQQYCRTAFQYCVSANDIARPHFVLQKSLKILTKRSRTSRNALSKNIK